MDESHRIIEFGHVDLFWPCISKKEVEPNSPTENLCLGRALYVCLRLNQKKKFLSLEDKPLDHLFPLNFCTSKTDTHLISFGPFSTKLASQNPSLEAPKVMTLATPKKSDTSNTISVFF